MRIEQGRGDTPPSLYYDLDAREVGEDTEGKICGGPTRTR
jgi:hypothetical protein